MREARSLRHMLAFTPSSEQLMQKGEGLLMHCTKNSGSSKQEEDLQQYHVWQHMLRYAAVKGVHALSLVHDPGDPPHVHRTGHGAAILSYAECTHKSTAKHGSLAHQQNRQREGVSAEGRRGTLTGALPEAAADAAADPAAAAAAAGAEEEVSDDWRVLRFERPFSHRV